MMPTATWEEVKGAILKLFPFNGTVYPYKSLVCAKEVFGIKPALKDVWAHCVPSGRPFGSLFQHLS